MTWNDDVTAATKCKCCSCFQLYLGYLNAVHILSLSLICRLPWPLLT